MALKWYTRARKFPQLIGRTPDGTRIPGGPYTYTQVAAGVVTAVLLAQTTWLWAHGSLMLNATIFIGATVGAVIAAGKLPPGMRNPLVLASGAINLMSSGYRLDGAPVPRCTVSRGTAVGPVTVFEASEPRQLELAPVVAAVEELVPLDQLMEPAITQPVVARPALTNVQRLLLGEGEAS